MPPLEYVRQATDDEQRARARETVTAAARRGEPPSTFDAADVAWAFRGHEDELAQLAQVADDERARRQERTHAQERARELGKVVEIVLREWDEAERAERLERARAEARRRLGWDEAAS